MTSRAAHKTASRIDFLDLLRIFAFLSVFAGHTFMLDLSKAAISPDLHISLRTLASVVMSLSLGGVAGVIVFFLVSGYIITHVLRSENSLEFLIRRAFRIYPLYLVALVIQTTGRYLMRDEFDLATFLAQATLFGDFFDADYALGSVEWTLRIEVLFYLLMAGFKRAGLFDHRLSALPYALLATSAVLIVLAPFPTATEWATGYATIYGHFLLMGSALYLAEHGVIRRDVATLHVGFYLGAYLILIAGFHKNWLETHAAVLAVALFLAAWLARHRIAPPLYVRRISELTYSVYLFHAWLYGHLFNAAVAAGISNGWSKTVATAALFTLCAIAVVVVEKPAIALGKKLSAIATRP